MLTDNCSFVVLIGTPLRVLRFAESVVSMLKHVHVVDDLALLKGLLEDVDVRVVLQIHAAINYN